MLLQNIQGLVIVPKQGKFKAPKSWVLLRSLLQPYTTVFKKRLEKPMLKGGRPARVCGKLNTIKEVE